MAHSATDKTPTSSTSSKTSSTPVPEKKSFYLGDLRGLDPIFQSVVNMLTPDEGAALQEQFRAMGAVAGDTKVDHNRFASLIGFRKGEFTRLVFELYDIDKNGFITEVDFVCATALFMKASPTEKVQRLFDVLDTNKDGVLDQNAEFQEMISGMYMALSGLGIAMPMTNILKFVRQLFPVKERGNYLISKEQYVAAALANPHVFQGLGVFNVDKEIIPPPLPKRGIPAPFGGTSWKTAIYMMVGMRLALGDSPSSGVHPPNSEDFKATNTFALPQTDLMNRNESWDFWGTGQSWKFTDYAPVVFKNIRKISGIDENCYMLSLGVEQLLGNLLLGNLSSFSIQGSEGRSGSFFYYSHDGRFLVKTIPDVECNSLLTMLKAYYEYLQKNPDSLLTRFFGLHKINNTVFVVMENVFDTQLPIHEVYDLKGSTVGRSSPSGVKKDLDLTRTIRLDNSTSRQLIAQIHKDADLLAQHNIMDYSLLVGIHFLNFPNNQSVEAPEKERINGTRFYRRNGGGIQAQDPRGGTLSEIYFFGVIDILTCYNLMKSSENLLKSFFNDKSQISAVPTPEYNQRFKAYVEKVLTGNK